MSHVERLRRTELLGGRRAFDYAGFEFLHAVWLGKLPAPSDTECLDLIPLLARWLRHAPFAHPLERLRLLTARKSLLCIIRAAGMEVDAFFDMAFGKLAPISSAPPWTRQKLSLVACIDSAWRPEMAEWHRIAPAEALTHVIAGLQDEPIGAAGLERFNELAVSLAQLTTADLPFVYLQDLADSAFMLAYATDREKYAGKRVLADQAAKMLRSRGFWSDAPHPVQGSRRQRPAIAIIAEKLYAGNMMHRCYGPQVADLQREFDVTFFADGMSPREGHAELAQHVVYFDPSPEKLDGLIRQVQELSPDVIYFPSVGMTPWTFALSSVRLAPLQLAGVGHPCPTASGAIDYQAVQTDVWHPQAASFEPPLRFDSHPLLIDQQTSEKVKVVFEARMRRGSSPKPVIAINSSSMKLNAEFLGTLRSLRDRCTIPVSIRFFPIGAGLRHRSLERRIQSWFPDAEVIEMTDFDTYLENLGQCDMVLKTFPFGGTNTTVDSMMLGLPVVCMDGPELHSRIDAVLLARAALEQDFLARDVEHYQQIALGLIHDSAARQRLGKLARQGVERALEGSARGRSLGDALSALLADGRPATGQD